MVTRRRFLAVAVATVSVAAARTAGAEVETDLAMRFFRDGGAYCFRLAPEGTNLADESTWTMMVLTSAANKRSEFPIRTMDPGPLRFREQALKDLGMAVTGIWRRERVRDEFFERFAAAIDSGDVRARVVTLAPPRLEGMTRIQRADYYLDFADKGSRIDFRGGTDLSSSRFLEYQTWVPD